MKKLKLDDIKKRQSSILEDVARFCERNEITYFLCGGTMLGAIRHKGFIPWDDDIDVMLPRPDYERLLREYKSDQNKLFTHQKIPQYNYPYAKLSDTTTIAKNKHHKNYTIGVNIDLFPLDGFPGESKEIKNHIRQINFYRLLLTYRHKQVAEENFLPKKLIAMIGKGVSKAISVNYICEKINKLAQKYDFETSENAGIAVWGYREREVCPQSVFTEAIDVCFEGNSYKGVKDYNIYLSNVYGNYMKLPPVDKRESHHFVDYYCK